MRIAIVAEPYVPIPPLQYGGIEQVIANLIKGLKQAGHEPILLAPGDSKVDCELIPTVEKALYFPKTKSEIKQHAKLVDKAMRRTHKELRAILPKVDIIHSHGFDLTRYAHFPNLTTIHNKITLYDPAYPRGELSYYLKRKDLLYYASISKNQQDACPELKFVANVYNGEDPKEFPLIMEPDNYLCFLGRIDRNKNPHLAIELALSLGMKIKLAGKIDHESEGYFEVEIKPYLKHRLVEFLGEIGFEEKVELLSHAKCNLHPTNFREPFGLTVLEAAYCGTPTLAIARGSMPELIEPERTGMLVEDFVEGRHVIQDCFNMDREYISSRARQLFNYQNMSRHYLEAYTTVIEQMKTARERQRPTNRIENVLGKIFRRLQERTSAY
jgi:glycosyltransferase involved in cell wall biosynthesis